MANMSNVTIKIIIIIYYTEKGQARGAGGQFISGKTSEMPPGYGQID